MGQNQGTNPMKIRCHTNLEVSEDWPEEMPCRPIIGDIIQSRQGLKLEVRRIKFVEVRRSKFVENGIEYGESKETLCYVELHLIPYRFENISTFQAWYKSFRKSCCIG